MIRYNVTVLCSWLTILTDTRLLHEISEQEQEDTENSLPGGFGSLDPAGRRGIKCVNYPRGTYYCICRGTSPLYYMNK